MPRSPWDMGGEPQSPPCDSRQVVGTAHPTFSTATYHVVYRLLSTSFSYRFTSSIHAMPTGTPCFWQ